MAPTESMAKQTKATWLTFWPMWVLANVVGWSLMYLIQLMPVPALGGMAGGALFIGMLQWLCLRKFLHMSYLWVLVSTITYGGFFWAAFLFGSYFLFVSVGYLFLLSGLQSFALSYLVDHAVAWAIVSPIALISALMIDIALDAALGFKSPSGTLDRIVIASIYGGLTGALLIALKASTKSRKDAVTCPWSRTPSP